MGTYSVFWKPGRQLDRFTRKLIQSSIVEFWDGFIWKLTQTKCYISYMVSVNKIRMYEFSSNTVCVNSW